MGRDSILYGNEYRSALPTDNSLTRLYNLFNQASDGSGDETVAEIMTPLAYEQFPYQESQFEEISRVGALLLDPQLGQTWPWIEVLGLDLDDAVRASMVLHVWVVKNGGRYDPSILDMPYFQEVFEKIAPREHIELTAKALTASVEQMRASNEAIPAMPISLQRYAYNPLIAHPLVDLGDQGIWAPQSMLVSRALYPANLYYRGVAAWGEPFTRSLGLSVEAYVGKQLGLIAGPSLLSEIVYGKPEKKSVDWIWVTDRAIVLVECKSARLSLGAQAGDGSLAALASRYLGHARAQVDATAELIRNRHERFDHIPSDRPIVGITVTSEPFYLGNSKLVEYGNSSITPSISLSLRDLEYWTSLSSGAAVDALLEVLYDQEKQTWSFSAALKDEKNDNARNPILDEAWKRFDFVGNKGAGVH